MEIKINKANSSVHFEESRIHTDVRDFLFNYGVKQFLNDSISSLSREGSKSTTKASSEEMLASINETMERLYAGEVRAARTVDTLGRMAFNLALKKVMNVWLKSHKGGNAVKDYPTARADAQVEYTKNAGKYDAMAQSLIDLTSGEEI
jgi:hypothetical protein